jgi:hypothetical protein
MSDSPPVVSDGRFVKGQSGNPNGRPPNTKNKLSNLRKELELAVIEHVGIEKIKRIINKVVEKAEAGDMRAAKLILDKVVPNASPGDEAADNGRTVVFRIENATFAQQQLEHKQPNSIDVQVTDVTIPAKQEPK